MTCRFTFGQLLIPKVIYVTLPVSNSTRYLAPHFLQQNISAASYVMISFVISKFLKVVSFADIV